MPTVVNADTAQDFARAFGDALNEYLKNRPMGQSEAARQLGIETSEPGKRRGGSRISSYCRDSKSGKRVTPDAKILYLACTKLPGFSFEYNGYRINAETIGRNGHEKPREQAEQLTFQFERQFNLTQKQGTVAVRVSRPAGRIEVSVSLNARAS
jgi:hypothetical protein